jgi:hypothetical protein
MIIMVTCMKYALSATKTWGNLSEEYKEKVFQILEVVQFPGQGER